MFIQTCIHLFIKTCIHLFLQTIHLFIQTIHLFIQTYTSIYTNNTYFIQIINSIYKHKHIRHKKLKTLIKIKQLKTRNMHIYHKKLRIKQLKMRKSNIYYIDSMMKVWLICQINCFRICHELSV